MSFVRVVFAVLALYLAYTVYDVLHTGVLLSRPGEHLAYTLNDSYDYIVIGAGSAGCVLASRLSEDNDVTVLLLEAGGDDRGDPTIMTPGLAYRLKHTHIDWGYYTEPQKHGLDAFVGKRSFWPRGKALGGTSNLNSMLYTRGHRLDFDRWAESGADGWSYNDVLPFFLKSEDIQDPELARSEYHGKGGPMKVTVPHTLPLTDFIIQAGLELGLKINDPNGATLEGISRSQSTSYKGIRWSTSRGYLHPVMSRENLHVRINTHVTKIVFEGNKVVAVEMIHKGRKEKIGVRKEVVLSTGAIGSPQILMLSGVGPKDHLKDLGIPVIADLPVGLNLQDHIYFEFCIGINQTMTATRKIQESYWTRAQYNIFGTGVLSSSHYVEVLVFDSTGEQSRKRNWPDLEIMFHETPSTVEGMQTFGYVDQVLKDSSHRSTHKDLFQCEPALLRPESRGTIRLRSRDPFDYPVIDPNYFQAQEDVDLLVRGINYCKRFLNTQSLRSLGAVLADKPGAICREHQYDTDGYWACMVKQMVHTIYHPSGTCKMGRAGDPTAVVDAQLRVHGIKGLRVADASIMPYITSANINAPVIMIGEKASHMIREERKR